VSLKDKAAGLARPEPSADVHDRPELSGDGNGKERPATFNNVQERSEPLPDLGIPDPGPDGPEQVPVRVAWARVRRTVGSVAKADTGTGINYTFRGIDRALNAFGPATLLHGVEVLPVKVEPSHRDTKTSTGKNSRECTVVVTYEIIGPMGDSILVQAAGEAMDASDKATAQAQSVALRTLLFLGGMIPTGDPHADGTHLERGEAQVRSPASYRDEALDPGTSRPRMAQIMAELRQHKMAGALVENERQEQEPIGDLVYRVGEERFVKPKPPPPGPVSPLTYSPDEIAEGS
jgi:hypothetical protein